MINMMFINKKVRSVPKPKWFTKELQEAIYFRNFLKEHGQHEESSKIRNELVLINVLQKEIHPGPPI